MTAMVLVCKLCRWRPPNDLQVTFVEAHFDLEPDHDPTDIRLELVAWCDWCEAEMSHDRTETMASGKVRHHYSCNRCHRSKTVTQAVKST